MRILKPIVAIAAMSLAGCSGANVATPIRDASQSVGSALRAHAAIGPHAATVILIIMENRDYDRVIGNARAPYINGTLVPQAALMTNSHAIAHPSQPNYLALLSGSAQGVADDSCPHTFHAANLGSEVIAKGKTFDGFSESMPRDGYTGCSSYPYSRKHNPWVDFANLPASSNLVWYDIPAPSGQPTVSYIIPNLCNDMHDCGTHVGDNWLKANLPSILQYDSANDGLLILTWDEADPDTNGTNQIATLLLGPMIVPGRYAQHVDHYAVLHTIETITGVTCTAKACSAPELAGMWQ